MIATLVLAAQPIIANTLLYIAKNEENTSLTQILTSSHR